MTKEELTAFVKEINKADRENLVAEIVEKLKADKPAEASPPESIGSVVKGITDLATIITELKGDLKALSEKVAVVETKAVDVITPEVPDHTDVIKGLQDELKAMTEKVEKISHNVTAAAPVSDPNVNTSVKKSSWDGVFTGLHA